MNPTTRNKTAPTSFRRHNGNVARLPHAVRHKLNLMLQDGLTYSSIIKALGEDGKGLSVVNLSRWRKGGYQDWLAEQAFILSTRARQETPHQLVQDFDATEVSAAALQLASLHVFEALRDPGSLNQKLGGDCAAFARLLNALARASRETMVLQKYREACAQARAALQGLKDPKRKLTDAERRSIVLEVDEILGLHTQGDNEDLAQNSGPESNNAPNEPRDEGPNDPNDPHHAATSASQENSEPQTPTSNPAPNSQELISSDEVDDKSMLDPGGEPLPPYAESIAGLAAGEPGSTPGMKKPAPICNGRDPLGSG
jgi:hypothetical protein